MADAVLLIDDDVDLLRAAGAQLERAGYDVTRELSGEAGLATWDRIRPDVVILDLDLPGMQGSEVLSHLRDRGAAVIVVAPSDQVSSVVRALQSGAESWVAKPVELSLLQFKARFFQFWSLHLGARLCCSQVHLERRQLRNLAHTKLRGDGSSQELIEILFL